MSASAQIFGRDSLIFKATNIMGLGIPGWLDKTFSPESPGLALGEISQQTAKEGDPRVIVWGRVRPIGGNLIHCQAPIKKMVKESSSGGGKGGGGSKKEQKVEHVFRTYAIGVCEGPITAFSRIWRNNKLVYDTRGNAWGAKNNQVFLRNFRLYLGAWNQMPAPALEAIWGAGNVPAYRGTAYMVSLNEDLTELGGSVPQWQFEVERAEGIQITSRPYAAENFERVNTDARIRGLKSVKHYETYGFDDAGSGANITGGTQRDLKVGFNFLEESASNANITGGSQRDTLIAYTNGEPDLASSAANITGGSQAVKLIQYTAGKVDPVTSNAAITGGTKV